MPGLDSYPKDRVGAKYETGQVKSGLPAKSVDGKEHMETGRPSQDADDKDPQ